MKKNRLIAAAEKLPAKYPGNGNWFDRITDQDLKAELLELRESINSNGLSNKSLERIREEVVEPMAKVKISKSIWSAWVRNGKK